MIVDAHADLAWNALTFGRDYTRAVEDTRASEISTDVPSHNGKTMLGYPDWVRGRVGIVFATLFAAPRRHKYGEWDTYCYDDSDGARKIFLKSVEYYHTLTRDNGDKFQIISNLEQLETRVADWEASVDAPAVGLVLLMEGADAIRKPHEVHEWHERGLRIISLSWSGTLYAGGTKEPGPISPAGYKLLDEMAKLGMILDLSHLSEEGALEALDHYPGTVIASHSNPLSRVPSRAPHERHLSDVVIREIASRGGVIGTVLYNPFLKDGWTPSSGGERVSLIDVAASMDYVCQILGNADHVGIGSDFDGGFGLEDTPRDLDSVADLRLIGNELANLGYSESDVQAILRENWLRTLRLGLPGV